MEDFSLAGLMGGVLGAFLIFMVTSLYGVGVGKRQRARERVGLLRLVGAEVQYNSETTSPTMDAWKDCRTVLAPRLKGEKFADLVNYYTLVQEAIDSKTKVGGGDEAGKVLAIVKEYAKGGFLKKNFRFF